VYVQSFFKELFLDVASRDNLRYNWKDSHERKFSFWPCLVCVCVCVCVCVSVCLLLLVTCTSYEDALLFLSLCLSLTFYTE
jgi:hypothetical protein